MPQIHIYAKTSPTALHDALIEEHRDIVAAIKLERMP